MLPVIGVHDNDGADEGWFDVGKNDPNEDDEVDVEDDNEDEDEDEEKLTE